MNSQPTLYVKGSFNGWSLDTPMIKITNHTFEGTMCLSSDMHRFKISNFDGTPDWTFSNIDLKSAPCPLDTVFDLARAHDVSNDLLINVTKAGLFTITLDLSHQTPTLRLTRKNNAVIEDVDRAIFSSELTAKVNTVPNWQYTTRAVSPNELYRHLAIEDVLSYPFVFGDNVDGYYEGRTHAITNSGKYRHQKGWILGGFLSFVNGHANNKQQARKARLLPYGIEHDYSDSQSTDRLSVIQGQRLACLAIESASQTKLAILPELNIGKRNSTLQVIDGCLICEIDKQYIPAGSEQFVAISANQPIDINEEAGQSPLVDTLLSSSKDTLCLRLTSKKPTKELTVYLSFSTTRDEAIQTAKSAAQDHAFLHHKKHLYDFLTTKNYLWTNDLQYNRSVMWARLASRSFVNKEFGKGIWAGLPWFKDCWGRDTFIALSGTSLINGMLEEAKHIIENFAGMQMMDKASLNYGRIPNRVTSKTNIIYNTTDGTPWMVREIMEYLNYSGDTEFIHSIYPVVKRFIEGIEMNYLADDGLMTHRDPDTWMDAKIEGKLPWSARGPKANDIQALWFESLQSAITLASLVGDETNQQHWKDLANKVHRNFNTKYWDHDKQRLADCLQTGDVANYSSRPNQLMILTIPNQKKLVSNEVAQYMIKNCVDELLFPWGICSLSQNHEDFHPFHDNQNQYHKDAAYHNGTIWGWNAGFTVSALTRFKQQDFAYQFSKNLSDQILSQGHRGTMSENLNAYQLNPKKLIESGTFSQAWSVSEFARNAQQDYLGYKPLLTNDRIYLEPHIPTQWTKFDASVPLGRSNSIWIHYEDDGSKIIFSVTPTDPVDEIDLHLKLTLANDQALLCIASLSERLQIVINKNDSTYQCNRSGVTALKTHAESFDLLENLSFASPNDELKHMALERTNYMYNKIVALNLTDSQD
ncbi:amylo-alpha-1,6-glucosidase [Vibrio tapetis]|uniref:Glycogen debranching enzyme n=1 Tax=Vibrio tapetis subsp. tapetis TaxID=1671868 RepID=A0A2N8ZK19_9VIBR|nr:amylo-alpha-1,6-glucosidase [Vibrio tapetis]SON52263.1 Glycogen debranching enzyme [Vibrio tapetis subsp. tapetis]